MIQLMPNIKRKANGQWDKGNNSGSRFTRERSLGNQHAKGNAPNRTSFDGSKVMDQHPSWKGGIQKSNDGYSKVIAPKIRVPMARYVYEQTYGKIPPGHVIYHKDKDVFNNDINNLECITRAELMIRNHLNQ